MCPRDGNRGQGTAGWWGREGYPSVGLSRPIEEGVVEGAGVGEHEFDGKLHLLILLVPAVDGHEQQLPVRFAAHDQKAASQAVQLWAGAARTILHVQHQPLGVLALQGAWLEQLLLLLGSNQLPVSVLYLDLLDAHFDHCMSGRWTEDSVRIVRFTRDTRGPTVGACAQGPKPEAW